VTQVRLSFGEVVLAANAGVMRRVNALRGGWADRFGAPADAWTADIEGCCAELAVAKTLGVYWHAYARNPKDLPGDVGGWQVRSTWRTTGRLIIHPEDTDAAVFVLVVGQAPYYRIAGWIRGLDAKRDEWWKEGDGRPAYFVPQRDLIPWEERPEGPVDARINGQEKE